VIEAILAALCIWFLLIEIRKIFILKHRYFIAIWNIVNFVPMILILATICLRAFK